MTAGQEVFGWHFLCDDGTRSQDGVRVEPGATETWDGPLDLCESGLHFCVRALDALGYARGGLIRRVRLSGNILQPEDENKGCATRRQELWRADSSTLLHTFACNVAEQALDAVASQGETVDPRSRAAIAVKRRWLRGEASDEELNAARAAARDAASAAASDAAWAAAWNAASDAAWNAASDAVRNAAWAAAAEAAWNAASDAAWNAAWDAAWDAMNAALEQRLLALPEARQ